MVFENGVAMPVLEFWFAGLQTCSERHVLLVSKAACRSAKLDFDDPWRSAASRAIPEDFVSILMVCVQDSSRVR